MSIVRVLIIDDDHLVCRSLETILAVDSEIEVVHAAQCANDLLNLYDTHKPDVVLLDIRLGGQNGLLVAEDLIQRYPAAKVVFLTTFADDDYIVRALRLGAKGYILKQHFETIAVALKAVHGGQRVYGDEIIFRLPKFLTAERRGANLTDKESEILACVAEGLSNQEIAARLHLSHGTVRNYISEMLEKLQLRDRTQLAIYYYRR